MAIDSLNKIPNEQLLALSMMSNGQLTSDSKSTEGTGDEMNLAFSLMMQNLMNSSKNSSTTSTGDEVDTKLVQQNSTGTNLERLAMIVNNSNRINATNNVSSNTDINTSVNKSGMSKIYNAVETASQKYGVDKNLILAIIKQESNFDSSAVSGAGAKGLMQIMPANFSSVGITDAFDINQNVNGGTKLIKQLLNQYNGNTEMALMAYNGGSGTMQRRGVSSSGDLYKMPQETQNYVPKVMGYYKNGV